MSRVHLLGRWLAVVAAVTAIVLVASGRAASAHADLLTSDPAPEPRPAQRTPISWIRSVMSPTVRKYDA